MEGKASGAGQGRRERERDELKGSRTTEEGEAERGEKLSERVIGWGGR